eukprot:713134-Prymnesium_polylepis.1
MRIRFRRHRRHPLASWRDGRVRTKGLQQRINVALFRWFVQREATLRVRLCFLAFREIVA